MSINDPGVDKVAARLTVDITPWQAQLKVAADSYQQFNEQITGEAKKAQDALMAAPKSNGNSYLADASGAIRTVKQQIQELQTQFKEGTVSAQQLFAQLSQLRDLNIKAFDKNTSIGLGNDTALRNSIVSAQTEISKLNDFEFQSELRLNQDKQASDEQYLAWWETQMAKKDADYAKYLVSEEAMEKKHYLALQENEKRDLQVRLAADKQYMADWTAMLKQQEAEQAASSARSTYQSTQHGSVFNALDQSTPGFTAGKMIAGMVGFQAAMSVYQTMVDGMKQVEAGAAGIQQVFEGQIKSQQSLNDVTNQAIGIAQHYGTQIGDVLDGLKLYGRQYKDVQTAMTLVNSATLLSVVDNVNLADANKALEATMNSLGLAAHTQADAYANSMRIVDSWSQLAHQASVSATQLMQATENSAGAAHAVGVNFDQLNALATSAVRNTGMTGLNIGNMLKSLFASIQTDKAAAALKTLDISIKQVGANGQTEFRPVFDVLLELSQKLQTTNDSQQKLLQTISGGKFQWSKVSSMLSDYNTIIDAYAVSINSAGAASQYAQVQMDTLGRDVQRLKDAFVGLAAQTDQNGLGTFLKSIVNGLTDLLTGLEKMPPVAGNVILVIGGLLIGLRTLVGVMNTVQPLAQGLLFVMQKWAPTMFAAVAGTEAETVATVGLTSAFTALDVVSGGLALAIGAVVAIVATSAIANGQATQATQDHTQALQDQIGAAQQEYNLALQKQQFMVTAITQEQDLKKALDDHTLSAKQHNTVLNDMVGLYQAVGKATGDESLQQVNASNVQNQSLNKEQQAISKLIDAKKTAYEDAVKINDQQIINDIAKTNQEITDINAHIVALGKETQASFGQLTLSDKLRYVGDEIARAHEFLMGNSKASHDYYVAGQNVLKESQAAQVQAQNNQLLGLQSHLAQDNYQLASNKLDLFNVDTSGVGDTVAPKNVGPTSTTTKKPSAVQKYTQPITDQAQATNTVLGDFKAKIDALQPSIQYWSDAMKLASQHMSQNSNDLKAQTAYTQAYHQEQNVLNQSIGVYDAENASIAKRLPQVRSQIDAVNQQHKAGKTTAQEHTAALSKLQAEYNQLTSAQKTNADAVVNARYTISQLTDAWKQQNSTIMNAQFAAKLKQDQGTIDNYTKSLTTATRAASDYSREMKAGETNVKNAPFSGKANSQMVAGYKGQVNELNTSNALLGSQNKAIQKTIADLNGELRKSTTEFHQGKITADDYATTQQSLKDKITQLTQQFYQNRDAVSANKDTIQQLRDELLQMNATVMNSQFTAVQRRDTQAIGEWTKAVTTANREVSAYGRQMTEAMADLTKQPSSMKDASAVMKAYTGDIKALTLANKDLSTENTKVQKNISDLNRELTQAAQNLKSGKITTDDYNTTTDNLKNQIDSLTQTLYQNKDAIQANSDAMANAASQVHDQIVSDLQKAYGEEQKIQDQNLTNSYNARLEKLNDQKTAIDGVIQSLQQQWQTQTNVDKLGELQNELTQVKSQRNHEIIDAHGNIQYTYDQTAATDLQKQITDQQTTIAHDAQIQQLNDQKTALDTQIQNLTDTYNTQKQQLDDYWAQRLSTDSLNTEADNLIHKNGLQGALDLVTSFTGQMTDKYNALQAAALAAGQAIAAGMGIQGPGGTGGSGSGSSSGGSSAGGGSSQKVWTFSDQHGNVVYTGTDYNLGKSMAGGTWQNGIWVDNNIGNAAFGGGIRRLPFASGGMVPKNIGTPGMDSVPAMLTPGEVVAPSWEDLTRFIQPASSSSSTQTISIGKIELPNVTDAASFVDELNAFGQQLYHYGKVG